MIEIMGNTYGVRDKLKAIGCVWNAARKCWIAPTEDIARQAREIVPTGGGRRGAGYQARTCKTCGCKINYGVYCGKCEYR